MVNDKKKATVVSKAGISSVITTTQMMGDGPGIVVISPPFEKGPDVLKKNGNDPLAMRGMSTTRASQANEIGSENENGYLPSEIKAKASLFSALDSDSSNYHGANNYQSPLSSPSVQGEQSISGDMTAPEADDDTLENAQMMGQQLGEDLEHPQELDIARDMDEAEEYLRTH